MEKFEQKDLKNEAKERFLEKLEDMVTSPKYKNREYDTLVVDKIRRGEKIRYNQEFEGLLIVACQDMRLTWEETDKLKKEIFE